MTDGAPLWPRTLAEKKKINVFFFPLNFFFKGADLSDGVLESLTRLHLITANQLWFYEAIRPQRFSLVPQVLTAKLTPDVSTRETSFSFFFFLIL